jgi:uncharacterized protein (TIGR03435 family)
LHRFVLVADCPNGFPQGTLVKRLAPLALLSLVPTFLNAAPTMGDLAPPIHFDKLFPEQPTANASFAALAGKVVVLELWATWCGPCVSAIPHLNELAEQFKNRPVVFLSVTDEDPAVVGAFLKKRPIRGLVGVAHTESALRLYDAQGVPATFLIDAEGRMAGSIDPETLSASMLEGLLAGRPLPLVNLKIVPHEGNTFTLGSRFAHNRFVASETLSGIAQELWGFQISPHRISGEPLNDPTTYDISLSLPGATSANFLSWARDVVSSAFHIKVNRETMEKDVWILANTGVKPPALKPAGTIKDLNNMGWYPAIPPATGGSLKLAYCPVPLIAAMLEGAVKKPVLDETGISGKYDIQMSYDKPDPEGAIEAIEKAGFKVEPARRRIDYLVVTTTQ